MCPTPPTWRCRVAGLRCAAWMLLSLALGRLKLCCCGGVYPAVLGRLKLWWGAAWMLRSFSVGWTETQAVVGLLSLALGRLKLWWG